MGNSQESTGRLTGTSCLLSSLSHSPCLLQAFKDTTLYFSRSGATLAMVIPAIGKLDEMLATAIIHKFVGKDMVEIQLSAPMQAALLVAKDVLNKYYALTDKSEVYRMAISTLLYLVNFFLTVR